MTGSTRVRDAGRDAGRHAGRDARRRFLRQTALWTAGLALGRPAAILHALGGSPSPLPPSPALTPQQSAFLAEVRRRHAGTQLRILTEASPSTLALRRLALREFQAATGIEARWRVASPGQARAMTRQEILERRGEFALVGMRPEWLHEFGHACRPLAVWDGRAEASYPGHERETFLSGPRERLGRLDGVDLALPLAASALLLYYRRDVLRRLELPPPRTLDQLLATARAVDKAMRPGLRGFAGPRLAGSLALARDALVWVWRHGGAMFGPDDMPSLEPAAFEAAMDRLLALGECMPPAATTWDWDGQAAAFARGEAAMCFAWHEDGLLFDDPDLSAVAGLVEAAPCPAPVALRAAGDCGRGEVPGASLFSGLGLAVLDQGGGGPASDAAWIFAQWLTSSDVSIRAALEGGACLTRRASFDDPRLRAAADAGCAVTRRAGLVLDALEHGVGLPPRFEGWSRLEQGPLAVAMGRLVTGQIGTRDAREICLAGAWRMLGEERGW